MANTDPTLLRRRRDRSSRFVDLVTAGSAATALAATGAVTIALAAPAIAAASGNQSVSQDPAGSGAEALAPAATDPAAVGAASRTTPGTAHPTAAA